MYHAAKKNLPQTRVLPLYTPEASDDEAAPLAYTAIEVEPQTAGPWQNATIETHPLSHPQGLIIRVQPPRAPKDGKLPHVPCDTVLVIDVSGSMSSEAKIPGSSKEESSGLSVLDLVKHACHTILSTLNDGDRLAIITFSNNAIEVQKLTSMTADNKKIAEQNIDRMYVQGATNLWAGLQKGIEAFGGEEDTGRVPAILILTDGLPNHMCPPQGYVPALRAMGNIVPTIHTFGFGFQLRSGLLKSLAEFGRGNYAFIADAGMIATVFVHAVAHLQSTFATNASLRLRYARQITLEQTAGPSVDQHCLELHESGHDLTIPLGNLQYGQSRDMYLRWKSHPEGLKECDVENEVEATLVYNLVTDSRRQTSIQSHCTQTNTDQLTSAEVAYTISRHQILNFLASIFPIDPLGEHRTCIPLASKSIGVYKKKASGGANGCDKVNKEDDEVVSEPLKQKQQELRTLVATLPAAAIPSDPQCASLMQDLVGPEPYGQVSLALSKQAYFERWGQHYLPSLHGAHARQLCNSFRDPGPLQYGLASPLFLACRDALSTAFDALPPPTPSILPIPPERQAITIPSYAASRYDGPFIDGGDLLRSRGLALMADGRVFRPSESMRSWNDRELPCFAGRTMVALAGGEKVRIASLKRGMSVETPVGPRKVAAVVVTPVKKATMVRLKGVLVTAWHPVMLPGKEGEGHESPGWVFPCHASKERARYTGCVYSVLLQRGENVDAHAIIMLGSGEDSPPLWGVTLGHGLLRGSDPRAHSFFGNYNRVVENLKRLTTGNHGQFVTGGIERSTKTGLVCGFEIWRSLNLVASLTTSEQQYENAKQVRRVSCMF
ncbi:unnamed protein product [Discula destructiva]